jgi:hypothetical protein
MATAPADPPASPPAGPPSAEGAIDIAASPEAVYAIISDPERMAQVAEETARILHRRRSVGRVGSRWVGINRNGWHVWPTLTRVTDADPGVRFAFEVGELGIPVARWQYDLSPTDDGVRVTERTWDRRPAWFVTASAPFTGVQDRDVRNTANIAATLARLKDAAEAPGAG